MISDDCQTGLLGRDNEETRLTFGSPGKLAALGLRDLITAMPNFYIPKFTLRELLGASEIVVPLEETPHVIIHEFPD